MISFVNSLFRAPHSALVFTLCSALPLAAADPAAVLPDESVAYMEMDSQAFYKLAENPVIKTLPLKDLEKLFLKLTKSTPEEQEAIKKMLTDETGVSYEELEKKAGRFAVCVHDVKIPANPTPETVGGEISIAHEFDADEAFMEKYFSAMVKVIRKEIERQGTASGDDVEKFISKAKEFFEHSAVEHAGVKVHVFKLKETDETKEAPAAVREWAYAIHDKMILAASGQEQVEDMLDRMKSGGETGSLAASAYYKNDHDKAGKTIALASLNLEFVMGLVEKFALPLAETGDVDVKKIWTTLGADKLRSAVLAAGAGAESIDLAALLTYSEKPGLFAALAIPGSGTPPTFLPKGLAAASYQQIDILKTLENIEKLAGEIDQRASAGIQMGLAMAQSQIGVDIKKDLLGQLGPDIWVAAKMDGKDKDKDAAKNLSGPDGSFALMAMMGLEGVYGVRLKDSKAFNLAVDTIINKVASKEAVFEIREYQGFSIHNIKEAPPEFKFGYVTTDEWLILSLGDQELLEQILGRIGKSGEEGFFAQKDVARHIDGLRGGQISTSAGDGGAILSTYCEMFDAMLKETGPRGKAPDVPFDELAKLLKVPLIFVDKSWLDEKHLEYRMRIAPKE